MRINWKIVNSLFIIAILLGLLVLCIKIWYDYKLMVSPFLPKYTVVYMNGQAINVLCFAVAGLIPSLFLRTKKFYKEATFCIVTFLLIGFTLKDYVMIYEHFY